jgi:hypothetical protein
MSQAPPLNPAQGFSADARFLSIERRLASPNARDNASFLVQAGTLVLLDPKLTRHPSARIEVARKLIELSRPGSRQEARLLGLWRKAHSEWANNEPGQTHKIKSLLTKDIIAPEGRFQEIAAQTRWDVTKLQILRLFDRLKRSKTPNAHSKLDGLYGPLLSQGAPRPSP